MIAANEVQPDLIGEKAFGLSSLPEFWTPRFLVISMELFRDFSASPVKGRGRLVTDWERRIKDALMSLGLHDDDQIIVRSSGRREGLSERGQYYSENGSVSTLRDCLSKCLEHLASDDGISSDGCALVVQKLITPISAFGHLSNERRCYEEQRDWLGQFEDVRGASKPFTVNLRDWRRKVAAKSHEGRSLSCNLSAQIAEVLKIPAAWASQYETRYHFEWVWDGRTIFVVQADRELPSPGVDPTNLPFISSASVRYVPKCLKVLEAEQGQRFAKVRNVLLYRRLGLATTRFYLLDDKRVIDQLASGSLSPELKSDLEELLRGSLVIRMDTSAMGDGSNQLLPRTDELRDLDRALGWLRDQCVRIREEMPDNDVVFIFHNFVPARASAFAYAVPGSRKVMIEALWGLPEGLYFNSHDKYVVDTLRTTLDESLARQVEYRVTIRKNYKHFIIAPNDNGRWTPMALSPPFDWRETISDSEVVKHIAAQSRKIAESEGKALSVMWLVDPQLDGLRESAIPWYHEPRDDKRFTAGLGQRKKTPYDKTIVVRSSKDIEALRREADKDKTAIRWVKIQLQEEALIRDKNTLKTIGELARAINGVVLLEGGVLSHAYYQLLQSEAVVEVVHPFEAIEEKREYNKLVRDKIPKRIEEGGEVVSTFSLSGESLLRALREKLTEESIEVLDAVDQGSILEELADVSEIVDSILTELGLTRSQLEQRQRDKRQKAGGFHEGVVLQDTTNPGPIAPDRDPRLFEDEIQQSSHAVLHPGTGRADARVKIHKSSDRREHSAAVETLLRLTVPMTVDKWTATTPETIIDRQTRTGARVRISGIRIGSELKIEVSVYASPDQLGLPFQGDTPAES